MTITVKYFASLRDEMGRSGDTLTTGDLRTVRDVWACITNEANNGGLPPNLLVAVNMAYANAEHPVSDGDEVAFFPPVTGG